MRPRGFPALHHLGPAHGNTGEIGTGADWRIMTDDQNETYSCITTSLGFKKSVNVYYTPVGHAAQLAIKGYCICGIFVGRWCWNSLVPCSCGAKRILSGDFGIDAMVFLSLSSAGLVSRQC